MGWMGLMGLVGLVGLVGFDGHGNGPLGLGEGRHRGGRGGGWKPGRLKLADSLQQDRRLRMPFPP
jgi:hypothetical protein